MRTTKELVVELRAGAGNADFVVLAVGFPTEVKMVSSTQTDADALEELDAPVARGGYPLAFIRSTRRATHGAIGSRPLYEYGDASRGQA